MDDLTAACEFSCSHEPAANRHISDALGDAVKSFFPVHLFYSGNPSLEALGTRSGMANLDKSFSSPMTIDNIRAVITGLRATFRSASVCSTVLPLVKPHRCANRWMCVSTGNVGVLHSAMLPLAHWDVTPESAAGQDTRKEKEKGKKKRTKERSKKRLRLLALMKEKVKEEIYWASLFPGLPYWAPRGQDRKTAAWYGLQTQCCAEQSRLHARATHLAERPINRWQHQNTHTALSQYKGKSSEYTAALYCTTLPLRM